MKQFFGVLIALLVGFFLSAMQSLASNDKLPVIDGKKIVATVNDEPITLEELNRATASSHEKRLRAVKAGQVDFSKIINRLINTKLIVLEARNMGIDELPEIKTAVADYARNMMMEMLLEDYVKDIAADDDEVGKIYRSIVREWKIKSAIIKKEEDAKKIESQLAEGKDFDEILGKAVQWGVAESDPKGEYLKNRDLAVPVARVVADMDIGDTSPVLSIGKKGFIIFKLEDSRLPEVEDPEAMKSARRQALNNKRIKAAQGYFSDLKKRYIKLDTALLDTLDYESETSGFDQLLKDDRIIVKVKGEAPITVAEFSQTLKQQFYHGVKKAIESKRINSRKYEVLDDMIQKKLLIKEALRKGIDKREDYRYRVQQHEHSLVFGAFLNKVIAPNIKLDMQDLKTYYGENSEAFASPKMIRIKSLVFRQRDDAVQAFNKLKNGTDFNWLGANTAGQVDKNTKGLLHFDGRLLTQAGLPEDVQQVVGTAKIGDYKLYQSPKGHFYVLFISQIVPPQPQPFDAVRQEIAEKVFSQKVNEDIEQWAAQLKKFYPVKIYRADFMK